MRIKSVRIKNFFSIQDISLDFDPNGIICIEGKNKDSAGSNGSGKSSIYEAIVWGLFGRTIRKSVQDSLVNTSAGKECEVVLQIDDDIKIHRVIKPPALSLVIGKVTYIKESYTETQKFIEEKLNINYKSFLVANVFGQQNEMDFISASLEDKRLMLKTFLGLEEFFSLRDKFKAKKTDVANKLKSIEFSCESTRKIIDKADKAISTANKAAQDLKDKFKLTSSYKLEDILLQEKNLETEIKALNDISGVIKTYEDLIVDYKNKIKGNTCKYCNTKLKALSSTDKEMYQQYIQDLDSELPKIRENHTNKIKVITNLRKSIPISSSEYHKIKDIEVYESDAKVNTKLKAEHEALFKEEIERKEKNAKYLDILKFWEGVFSEQGIVKYVIQNVLEHFNSRCMYYLSILTNGKCTIKFNDSFEEVITINGQLTYYHSLSGGERKKINFAVLLALQSLLDFTSKAKFDCILLDEVVESIDDESINNFYTLINELSKVKAVFIISHNNTLKDLLMNKRKIKLVKSKGITKLENS